MSLTYEELECRLMKAEYDLAEMEKFTDGLIQQKVQAAREQFIKEIEQWADSQINMPSRYYGALIAKLKQLKQTK